MTLFEVRLCHALEEALHAAGDPFPISRAARLAIDGTLGEALRQWDLAVVDTRPPLPRTPLEVAP